MNFADEVPEDRGFVRYVARAYRRAVPLMAYLCMAVEAEF